MVASSENDDFPPGGGESSALIRERDWSSHPLGAPTQWPLALRLALQNCLHATFPTSLLWGEELLQFYNDGYARIMGDKHPQGLGRAVRENWPEIWPAVEPLFKEVFSTGCPVYRENTPLLIKRHGFLEECYFTFCFSPIFDESGAIVGQQITATETTSSVLMQRRLQTLRKLGLELNRRKKVKAVFSNACKVLSQSTGDLPAMLLYAQKGSRSRAELMCSTGIARDSGWSPSSLPVDKAKQGPHGDPVSGHFGTLDAGGQLIDPQSLLGPAPTELDEPVPQQAFVCPLLQEDAGEERQVGFFVFFLSPRLSFDEDYRTFLSEIVRNVAVAYQSARHREEELELARAQVELVGQRIEARYLREKAHILESIHDPFYALDENWRVTYVNRAARQAPRWPKEQFLGQVVWELFPHIKGTNLEAAFREAAETGESQHIGFQSELTGRYSRVHVYPWAGGVSVTYRDISEERRTAEALRKSEARFRAVVEGSLDVIAIVEPNGTFTFLSPSAISTFGRSEEQLSNFFELLDSEQAHKARGIFTRLLLEISPQEDFVVFIGDDEDRAKEGEQEQARRWYSVKAKNLLEQEGVNGILLSIRDVTKIKRYQTELEEAKARAEEMTHLKSTLLANMSHEIRTPLTSMIGMASLLAKEVPEEHRRFARDIERGGRRLATTLNSVLTLAQIEGRAMQIQLDDVELSKEVDEVTNGLAYLAREKALTLMVEVPDEPIYARMDPAFLTGVLNNLVGNAIKFTEEGSVMVRLFAENQRCIIEVEDTGIGIEEHFLPQLFDEFRQESTGMGRAFEGVGLGLTITRRMVEVMEGTISVKSTKGEGTTFRLTFPQLLHPQRLASLSVVEEAALPNVEAGERPSMLVVEDDDAIRSIVTHLLREEFEVTAVPDAETALEQALKTDFDIVLLDIGLPGMSGVEALHRLREMSGYQELPIIALSGYALPDDRRRFVEEGFTEHIAKPFVPDELKCRLRQLV